VDEIEEEEATMEAQDAHRTPAISILTGLDLFFPLPRVAWRGKAGLITKVKNT
jgi:hypothetical protein